MFNLATTSVANISLVRTLYSGVFIGATVSVISRLCDRSLSRLLNQCVILYGRGVKNSILKRTSQTDKQLKNKTHVLHVLLEKLMFSMFYWKITPEENATNI